MRASKNKIDKHVWFQADFFEEKALTDDFKVYSFNIETQLRYKILNGLYTKNCSERDIDIEENKIPIKTVFEIFGYDKKQISEWQNAKTIPYDVIMDICNKLDISPMSILSENKYADSYISKLYDINELRDNFFNLRNTFDDDLKDKYKDLIEQLKEIQGIRIDSNCIEFKGIVVESFFDLPPSEAGNTIIKTINKGFKPNVVAKYGYQDNNFTLTLYIN